MPSPSPSPPSPPSPSTAPDREPYGSEVVRGSSRPPSELLVALDQLAAAGDDDDDGLDWGRAIVSLPEWRREGLDDDIDDRAVLGDLVRLVRHLYGVVRAQDDELRNLTRALAPKRRVRGARAEAAVTRVNRTENVSARVSS